MSSEAVQRAVNPGDEVFALWSARFGTTELLD
jgi:hypothetical protein